MMLLRGDSRAARHMATSRSTTLGTERGVKGQHPAPSGDIDGVVTCRTHPYLGTRGHLLRRAGHDAQGVEGEDAELPGAHCWLRRGQEPRGGSGTVTRGDSPCLPSPRRRTLSMEPFWKTCCSSHTTQYSLSVGILCSAYFMI